MFFKVIGTITILKIHVCLASLQRALKTPHSSNGNCRVYSANKFCTVDTMLDSILPSLPYLTAHEKKWQFVNNAQGHAYRKYASLLVHPGGFGRQVSRDRAQMKLGST